MNNDECMKAVPALERWFQSQGMSPDDAGVTMIFLHAKLLAQKTRDTKELQQAINIYRDCLTVEIAAILRGIE